MPASPESKHHIVQQTEPNPATSTSPSSSKWEIALLPHDDVLLCGASDGAEDEEEAGQVMARVVDMEFYDDETIYLVVRRWRLGPDGEEVE
ncbi:hypothetical protein HK102_012016, partial [Quaeritorhiza haematococci]